MVLKGLCTWTCLASDKMDCGLKYELWIQEDLGSFPNSTFLVIWLFVWLHRPDLQNGDNNFSRYSCYKEQI